VSIDLWGVLLSAVVTAVVGVLVMESYQTTPWLADKLMRWSVRLRYADNPERGKVRGEELTSLLEDLPTLFKFPTACGFLLRALAYRLKGGRETPRDQLLRDQLLKVRVRRHWACLLPVLLQTFVLVVVAFVLSQLVSDDLWVVRQSVLWCLAVAAVLRFAWKALKWWREIFIVTDKFFMVTSGVFGRKISMMPTAKVTDLTYLRTAGGRVLGYGTIRVESAGQKQDTASIGYLPKPGSVFDAIAELIFGVKS
jgi:hypothetical protein